MVYAVLGAVVILLFAALATVQLASDAILSSAAASGSLPARLPALLGVRTYSAIEKIAPAPYVEAMLARAAYDRGDLRTAESHARRLPPSNQRDEWMGRIELARGNDLLAQEYFLSANDVFSIGAEVDRLARSDPAAAYALESRMKARLAGAATHPDALADAYWRLGQLATLRARTQARARARWLRLGMDDYERALALAPLSGKYLLAAGVQALDLRDPVTGARYFHRAVDANPANADAYAGLGLCALALGRTREAHADAEKSRSFDSHSPMLRTLDTRLAPAHR